MCVELRLGSNFHFDIISSCVSCKPFMHTHTNTHAHTHTHTHTHTKTHTHRHTHTHAHTHAHTHTHTETHMHTHVHTHIHAQAAKQAAKPAAAKKGSSAPGGYTCPELCYIDVHTVRYAHTHCTSCTHTVRYASPCRVPQKQPQPPTAARARGAA